MLKENKFKESLHESAKMIAEEVAKEEQHETELQPLKVRQQQIEQEIEQHVLTLEQKMYDGLQTCLIALKECADLPKSYDEVVQELQSCLSLIDSPEVLIKLGESLLSDISWKTSLKISDKCMTTLYLGAKSVFDKKDYEAAEKA